MASINNYSNLFTKNNTSKTSSDNSLISVGSKGTDVTSIFSEDSITCPILTFPSDLTERPDKKFKCLELYILKDASYTQIIDNITSNVKNSNESKAETKSEDIGNDGSSGGSLLDSLTSKVTAFASSLSSFSTNLVDSAVQGIDSATAIDPKKLSSDDFHCVIRLPIPNNLTEDDAHSYQNENGLMNETFQKNYNDYTGMFDKITQTGMQMMSDRRTKRKFIPQIPILNPNTWKKFNGSELKSFKFTFFFVPRDKAEAESMMKIVYTLKKYSYGARNGEMTAAIASKITDSSTAQSLAKVGGNYLVSAPPKVLLKFTNPWLQKLVNPGVCVISSIGTTYNEGNAVGMTLDGVPRFIEINVGFDEYNVRFQEDFAVFK